MIDLVLHNSGYDHIRSILPCYLLLQLTAHARTQFTLPPFPPCFYCHKQADNACQENVTVPFVIVKKKLKSKLVEIFNTVGDGLCSLGLATHTYKVKKFVLFLKIRKTERK
jgi:hypothetical protein